MLVSNIGQTQTANAQLTHNQRAQRFTTGAHATGYFLSTVDVKFHEAPTNLTVKLMRGSPAGIEVATLTNPGTLAAGDLTFTAPEGTLLEPSTNYWLVFAATTGSISRMTLGTEDEGGLPGWSIHNHSQRKSKTGMASWEAFTNAPLLHPVEGHPEHGDRAVEAGDADV